MKKSILSIIFAALSVSLGITTISVAKFAKKETEEVAASSTKSFTGLYQKVTSLTSISDGDQVLLVSNDGHVIRDLGGNPGFLYTTTDRVHLSSDKNLVYLNNAYVTPQTIRIHDNDQYSFYGEYNPFSRYSANGYIAFDNRGDGIHEGSIDYIGDNIGILYFKDGSGIRKTICPESSFTLSYHDNNMYVHNVAEDLSLVYGGGYAERFYLSGGNWSNINIYKKAVISSFTMTHGLNKTEYHSGDKIELDGLSVRVNLIGGSQYDVSYFYNPSYFTSYDYVYGTGNTTNDVYFVDQTNALQVSLTVVPTTTPYERLTSPQRGYEGRYYLATEIGSTKYLWNGYTATGSEIYSALFYNAGGKECVDVNSSTDVDTKRTRAKMDIVRYSDNYYKLIGDTSYYVKLNGDYTIRYEIKAMDAAVVSFVYDSTNKYVYAALVENNVVTNKVLSFHNNQYKFIEKGTSNAGVFRFYHINDPETINQDVRYIVNEMKRVFSLCNDKGETNFSIDVNQGIQRWNNLSASFWGLGLDSQSFLRNVTYTHNQETKDSLEDLIDRYDYIILKYPSLDDFMARRQVAEQLQPQQSPFVTTYLQANRDASITLIVVISITSTSLLSVLLIVKKRKGSFSK